MPMMRRHKQRGATLIEVMVSVLITVIGVLGAASLQMNSVKFNHLANTRSYATMLAYDVIDRMRANRDPALLGNYDLALSASAPSASTQSGSSIAALDLQDWLSELSASLPGGDGSIVRNGSTFTITVQWDESRVSQTREPGSGTTESFSFVTEL
ncbi:MAG: type IV pilus assembly protein PilV [Bacteroidia bacterium]|jgi:type IV pilus assembly protein PilV